MLKKIRDFMDADVAMVILIDTIEDFEILASIMQTIGLNRLNYEAYKDDITNYMLELRMPYYRYLAMMQELRKSGYTLKPETKVDIFNRLTKIES